MSLESHVQIWLLCYCYFFTGLDSYTLLLSLVIWSTLLLLFICNDLYVITYSEDVCINPAFGFCSREYVLLHENSATWAPITTYQLLGKVAISFVLRPLVHSIKVAKLNEVSISRHFGTRVFCEAPDYLVEMVPPAVHLDFCSHNMGLVTTLFDQGRFLTHFWLCFS